MRSILITALALALGLGAVAQGPPKNAVDITNLPATASQGATTAPSASTDASSGVIRVFIGSLSGADATSIQGLLMQALFQSKKVVITENQGNANLILQGRVLRQPIPVAADSSSAAGGKKKHARRKATAPDTTDPSVIQDLQALKQSGNLTDLGAVTAAGSSLGDLNTLSLSSPGMGLGMGMGSGEEDLSHFQFRLYLQLVNPDGDLVWMSAQGPQAPPYAAASEAVSATVQPLLAAIASLPKASNSDQPY